MSSGGLSLIQISTGTESEWLACDQVLEVGQPGYISDLGCIVIGDGINNFSSLPRICGEPPCNAEFFTINGGDAMPNTFNGANSVYIDIDNMTSNISLDSYVQTGAIENAKFRFRKIDTSPFKITFNDGVVDYDFVNERGEFICLTWCNGSFNV